MPTVTKHDASARYAAHYMVDDTLVWIEPSGALVCANPYHYGATDCSHVIAAKNMVAQVGLANEIIDEIIAEENSR